MTDVRRTGKKNWDIESNLSLFSMTMVTQPIHPPADSITKTKAPKKPVIRVSAVVVDSPVVATVVTGFRGAVGVLALLPVVGAVGAH